MVVLSGRWASCWPISLYIFFNAPTGINHRVVVVPDHFYDRIGSWYSPIKAKVNFNSLIYMTVAEAKPDKDGRKAYELRCIKKESGEPVRIPIHDLTKKALPEILQRAAQRNVMIGDNADGRVIAFDK